MDNLLQFFTYEHLPAHLQAVSKPFGDLARNLAATLPANAESTTALRCSRPRIARSVPGCSSSRRRVPKAAGLGRNPNCEACAARRDRAV